MEIKLKTEVKKYLERELRDYKDNKKLIEELRLDIIEGSPSITLGVPGNPNKGNECQTKKVNDLITNNQINRLENMCKKISKVLDGLDGAQHELYNRHFEKGESKTKICIEMHIGEATFHRYKNKIIYGLAEELGYI